MSAENLNDRPPLWNPNAAANWCIIFTPAFGAYLHMLNWRSLGESGRAANSQRWFCIAVGLLVFYALSAIAMPGLPTDSLTRLVGFIFLLAWYFGSARSQATYIKERFGPSYPKRTWAKPLGIAIACVLGFFLVIFLGALAFQDQAAHKQHSGPKIAAERESRSSNDPASTSIQESLRTIDESAPPAPRFNSAEDNAKYLRWLHAASTRLESALPNQQSRNEFLQTLWYESRRAGLDVGLVLAMVENISGFRQYAISPDGSLGYMGIPTRWLRLLGDGNSRQAFQAQTNLRLGCMVLRHYLDEANGDLEIAVYNYSDTNDLAFGRAVGKARLRWLKLE